MDTSYIRPGVIALIIFGVFLALCIKEFEKDTYDSFRPWYWITAIAPGLVFLYFLGHAVGLIGTAAGSVERYVANAEEREQALRTCPNMFGFSSEVEGKDCKSAKAAEQVLAQQRQTKEIDSLGRQQFR